MRDAQNGFPGLHVRAAFDLLVLGSFVQAKS